MNKEETVKQNMGLIVSIANKFYGASKEDLIAAGILGIMKAIRNFDSNIKVKFSTYARDYIFGEMYELVYHMQPLKVNKELLTLCKKIEQTRYQLAQTYGYIPKNEELASFLGIPLTQLEQAILCVGEVLSLEREKEESRNLAEVVPFVESVSLDDKILLQQGLDTLPESEQQILDYRYFQDMTQSEVAKAMHMTQVMVSRYEKKGLSRLKEYCESA